MLAQILGGGTTSRLYQALVVEQKIAASAGAWYSGTSVDLGRFGLYGQPTPTSDVAALEVAIDAEIARIIEHGVTRVELDRAKAGMIAAATYARDSVTRTARIFGRSLVIGRTVEDVESWPERVELVTPEQVQAAALHVLDIRRSVTGLLLPKKKG
jgi:zinc protease